MLHKRESLSEGVAKHDCAPVGILPSCATWAIASPFRAPTVYITASLQVLRELDYAGVPGLGDVWDVKVDGDAGLPAPRQAAAVHCSQRLVSRAWS